MATGQGAPAGTSPAETAGASSPAGSPAMQKDTARRTASQRGSSKELMFRSAAFAQQ